MSLGPECVSDEGLGPLIRPSQLEVKSTERESSQPARLCLVRECRPSAGLVPPTASRHLHPFCR